MDDAAILADRDWWREFGALFGWKLYGWNYRQSASFFRADGLLQDVDATLRRDIEAAIKKQAGKR